VDQGKLDRIVQQRKFKRMESADRYAEQSRERLIRNMETKIRTTMIGSLSLMEEKFGFLWGRGKSRGQMTQQELDMEQLKDELRTEILNGGNNQLRAAVAELNQYDIKWNRYKFHSNLGNEEQK